jgi:hypothetical protein
MTEHIDVWVTVTQEDLNQGVANHCTLCPLALAVDRVLRRPYAASVGGVSLRIHVGIPVEGSGRSQVSSSLLPLEAQLFVYQFDNPDASGRIVTGSSPASLLLKLPPKLIREGARLAIQHREVDPELRSYALKERWNLFYGEML